ncbi:heavy metal-associated domain protein [beta proteobacterium KB13]|uniref:Heavy metal-associated domain protein n=1 Tax=beta proteobacterium KB13 TaxID=314607 RepID=B6BT90_9PROT|nr:heavy metal-associated domain protein [beta proteobacterium KB13]
MKKMLILFTFLTTSVYAATQKIEVNGMVCAFCAQGIEKSLSKIETTKDVYVNLDEGFVILESSNDGLKEDKIKKIIVDSGYDVTKISLVNETADVIRKQYEKE